MMEVKQLKCGSVETIDDVLRNVTNAMWHHVNKKTPDTMSDEEVEKSWEEINDNNSDSSGDKSEEVGDLTREVFNDKEENYGSRRLDTEGIFVLGITWSNGTN